jgi:hypothetical protein
MDLSPCDFRVFSPLKKVLKGHRFGSDEDMKTTLVQWFQQQPKELYVEGIHLLVHLWNACLTHGDCFNDLYSFAENHP